MCTLPTNLALGKKIHEGTHWETTTVRFLIKKLWEARLHTSTPSYSPRPPTTVSPPPEAHSSRPTTPYSARHPRRYSEWFKPLDTAQKPSQLPSQQSPANSRGPAASSQERTQSTHSSDRTTPPSIRLHQAYTFLDQLGISAKSISWLIVQHLPIPPTVGDLNMVASSMDKGIAHPRVR